MTDGGHSRREWLQWCGGLGVIAGIAGVAGCIGEDDEPLELTADDGTSDTSSDEDTDEVDSAVEDDDADAGDTEDADDATDDDADAEERADDDEDDQSKPDGSARLATLLPKTGDLASFGQSMTNAATLAATQIDEESSLEVEVRTEDTETSPEVAVARAQDLLAAGHESIIGAAATHITSEVAENVTIPQNATLVSPSSTGTGDLDPSFLRTVPHDRLQGAALADGAIGSFDPDSVALIALDNQYMAGIAEATASAVADRGLDITTTVFYEFGQSSYGAELEAALENDPDVLLVQGFHDVTAPLVQQYYEAFDTGAGIVVSDALVDADFVERVEHPMNDVVGVRLAERGPFGEAFERLYQHTYSVDPEPFAANAYDAAAVVLLATFAAGDTTGTAVREAIPPVTAGGGTQITPENLPEGAALAAAGESVRYVGASGPIEFTNGGDLSVASFELAQVEGNTFETVESFIVES
ncbi:ABC transporter substrate-binding protein [Halobacteria archaeon AArc-curdl1]|uniref:ABC transporter substrate-binding protein n=1 Tax=Natronosalvus hydrolyticus TaxID=2979988 RepID=A0AAP2Z8S8_9EURY|nr:ABC transporter substrate-binding protein [Halobacteria archaeon AArc-curdl1]